MNLKDIEIIVTEQPTGEISAGAGYGTSGQTFSFGIKKITLLVMLLNLTLI